MVLHGVGVFFVTDDDERMEEDDWKCVGERDEQAVGQWPKRCSCGIGAGIRWRGAPASATLRK